MRDIKPCKQKSRCELAREWDQLANERHAQIVSGSDISFTHVLVPTVLRLLAHADTTTVIDVGSGTGDLTVRLSNISGTVIGVEPSRACIELARSHTRGTTDVYFVEAYLEEAVGTLAGKGCTAAVASMTLMTAPDTRGLARALAQLLPRGGHFAATLCHPWFWPKYWGYWTAPWFDYTKEIYIEAPFAISRKRTDIRTTHIHRPLEQYVGVFADAGFRVASMLEPMPTPEMEVLYPEPWPFPHFLAILWERT